MTACPSHPRSEGRTEERCHIFRHLWSRPGSEIRWFYGSCRWRIFFPITTLRLSPNPTMENQTHNAAESEKLHHRHFLRDAGVQIGEGDCGCIFHALKNHWSSTFFNSTELNFKHWALLSSEQLAQIQPFNIKLNAFSSSEIWSTAVAAVHFKQLGQRAIARLLCDAPLRV